MYRDDMPHGSWAPCLVQRDGYNFYGGVDRVEITLGEGT